MGFREKSPGTSVHRSLKIRSFLAKSLITTVFLLCFFLGLSTLLAYNNRLTRHEEEIAFLREQARLDIASAIHAKREHVISKRDAVQDDDGQDQKGLITTTFGQGTTYTRWGRRDCPSGPNTKMVYSGLAATSHHGHTGGGSNFLCLDFNVTYTPGKFVNGNQGSSYIYGVEYRDADWIKTLFKVDDSIEGNSLNQHSVPCSLCMAKRKMNHVMIPGRRSCPDGWSMEYRGFIMAEAHGHAHSSQYLCVDEQPQVVPGTHGDQGGAFIYMVETQCASLLCEPFILGRELQCVVCAI